MYYNNCLKGYFMPHPPKINKLCAELRLHIKTSCPPGSKIPSERQLAESMKVSSRTLGTVLRRLADEGLIVRTRQGTFVCDVEKKNNSKTSNDVILLLPSSDFLFSCNMISQLANSDMIDGARAAASKYGCNVVTIPVADINTQEDIDIERFFHIPQNSNILFESKWFEKLFPLLAEKKCRIGCLNCGPLHQENPFGENDWYMVGYGACIIQSFSFTVKRMAQLGAKNLFCFGVADGVVYDNAQQLFAAALQENNIKGKLFLQERGIPPHKFLAELKKVWNLAEYDAILLHVNSFIFSDMKEDFYDFLNIPVSLPVMLSETELFNQERLRVNAEIFFLPVREYAQKASEFLISGEHGQIFYNAQYKIRKNNTILNIGEEKND